MKNLHLWEKIVKEAGGVLEYTDKSSVYSRFNNQWIVIVDQNGYLQIQFRISESEVDTRACEDLIVNGHYISEINDSRYYEIHRIFNEFKDKCIQ